MTDKTPYTYVLLRYRHDPLTGEFANVGVVVHAAQAGFLGVKVRRTLGRLSAIFPGIDGDAFKSALRSIERGLKRFADKEAADLLRSLSDASQFSRRVLANDDSSFIWSAMGSGVSSDPTQTLDKLYERFVARYDEKGRATRDDAAVWKPMRNLLVERQIADRLQAITISSPLDQVEFEHAWKNGAWHCYQPLSFDLSSGDSIREKANRWAGQLLSLRDAAEPFKTHFLVGAPTNPYLLDDYQRAMAILRLGPGDPKVIEESAFNTLVDEIEDEIRAHEAAQV